MKEAEWSRSRRAPHVDDYIKVGMISIAIQAMILPACYLLSPRPSENIPTKFHYEQITKHLMVLARLLNDLQSYEKEYLEGKLNMVTLLKEGSALLGIDDSIAHVNRIVEATKKEFLELALVEGSIGCLDVPKEWKQLHMSGLKSFQMFFNGENAFDSPTALLRGIRKAIYDPLTLECGPSHDLASEDTKNIGVEDQAAIDVTGWLLGQGWHFLTEKKLNESAASSWAVKKDGPAGQGGPGRRVRNIIRPPRPHLRRTTIASAAPAHPRYGSPFVRMGLGNVMFAGV